MQSFENSEVLKGQTTDCFGHLVRTGDLTMIFVQKITPARCAFRNGMIRRVTVEAWDQLELAVMMDEQYRVRSRDVCHQVDLIRT